MKETLTKSKPHRFAELYKKIKFPTWTCLILLILINNLNLDRLFSHSLCSLNRQVMTTFRILQWFLRDWLNPSYYLRFHTHHNSVLMPVSLQSTQANFSKLHRLAAFLCAGAGNENKKQSQLSKHRHFRR